jgi:hypothetical protein
MSTLEITIASQSTAKARSPNGAQGEAASGCALSVFMSRMLRLEGET